MRDFYYLLCRPKYAFLTSDKQFSENPDMGKWLRFDWTPEAISSYGIIFFIAFGSIALACQGRKIWKNKSGASVSVMWTFIFFFMFLTYPIIGIERQNNLLCWQGILRILFYLPILCGLYRFAVFTKKDAALARILFIMIFVMIEYPITGEFIYTVINSLGVFGVAAQGVLLHKEGKTGVVSPILLFAYAANTILWVWYNHQIHDRFLFVNAVFFLAAYLFTITVWVQIRFRELRTA
jgi:hypothetical protein